jgi:hypothetical protein
MDSELSPAVLSVAEIMREIREELSPTELRRAAWAATLENPTVSVPQLQHLDHLLEAVRNGATKAGEAPPSPHTLRARAGGVLVGLVRRALFWYTPQLHVFHLQVSSALDEQMRVNRALSDDLRELQIQIAGLKKRVESLETREKSR